jgi:hypothetical protein
LTQLKITAFKSRGTFTLEGDDFTIEPKGFFQSSAVLKKGTTIVAKAEKPSFLKRRFEITSAGHRLVLESQGWMGKHYNLLLGARKVGAIQRLGFAGRRYELDFPEDVPLVLQVFLTYLVAAQAKRENAAAAGG